MSQNKNIPVSFGTTVSSFTDFFPTVKEARAAARKWVKSWLSPRARKSGEFYKVLSKNSFALKHVSGGTLVMASVIIPE